MDSIPNYKIFNQVVVRTPYFPITKLRSWLHRLDESLDFLEEILIMPDVQEAIFLASPVLYDELTKYLDKSLPKKEIKKFSLSIIKYLSRMSFRCTPFGLFAGCSIVKIEEISNIEMPETSKYKRFTRLDMDYLCNLALYLSKMDKVRKLLVYYPNTTCYVVGSKLRYIEYKYINGTRKHQISSIKNSPFLERILNLAEKGANLSTLHLSLTDYKIDNLQTFQYINELINNQVLISELDISITDQDPLNQLISILNKYDELSEYTDKLLNLSKLLQKLDTHPIGVNKQIYDDILNLIFSLGAPYNIQYLFQCDLLKPLEKKSLSGTFQQELMEIIPLLYKITPNYQDAKYDHLISSFQKRYEGIEVPILQMLDIDIGLDYKNLATNGNAGLLKGIPIHQDNSTTKLFKTNRFQLHLYSKVLKAAQQNKQCVELVLEDFQEVEKNIHINLPDTFSVLCSILSQVSSKPKCYIYSIGGASAANLFARFGHLDPEILGLLQQICQKEEELNNDKKIYAEIVHLPEARAGNILLRPRLRQYEIPYLAKSGVEKTYQVNLSDIKVALENNKFILRSKKLNKEIIPLLTCAHNYSDAMPIYEFLCKTQDHNKKTAIGLYLGEIFDEFSYIPQIFYKNIVLSLERWKIPHHHFAHLMNQVRIENSLVPITKWGEEIGLKRFLILYEGDNELFIDIENRVCLEILWNATKNKKFFFLYGYPFNNSDPIISSEEGSFTNQFIFSFYKNSNKL